MLLNGYKSRIEIENEIMEKKMPLFTLQKTDKEYFFKGWYTTLTDRLKFKLKLVLPPYYPDRMPTLFVISPITLWKYRNKGTINSIGVSHNFHTDSNSPYGHVQICHLNDQNWDASNTCVGVFLKGILWLEAYSIHLREGRNISDIIDNFKIGLNNDDRI